jgi:hypothetical protein
MNLRYTFSQEIRRSLLQKSLLLLEVERGRGEPYLQLHSINPLRFLSLGKLRKKWISVMIGKAEPPPRNKNILNLPYIDSEDEEEPVETEHEEVVAEQGLLEGVPVGEPVTEHKDLLSQDPKGYQDQQVAEASTNKPNKSSSQKINQLLRQVYDLKVLEREIKRRNKNLVERNVELYDYFHILAKMYVKMEKKNGKLIQAN